MSRRSLSRSRGAAVVVATLGVVAAAAFVLPTVASAQPIPPVPAAHTWAPVSSAAIHPGVLTTTQGAGACTSNFVYTAGPRVFIGQAAHCAGTGPETETDGCGSATLPLGTKVTIDGASRPGTLVYSSWVTMQADHEADPDTCGYNDLGLVEIDPADVAKVNPSLPFFGGPTGLNTAGLPSGAEVFSFGNSPLRGGISALGPKTGISAGDVGGGFGHNIYTASPGVPGDSGSAFVDAQGRAVGLLSTLNLAPLPGSNTTADISRSLAYANAHGGLGQIDLVNGTQAFSSGPAAGVPAALFSPLARPAGQA